MDKRIFVLNRGKKAFVENSEIFIDGENFILEEFLSENYSEAILEFLKLKYCFLAIFRPERFLNPSVDIRKLIESCVNSLYKNEHYAICQPAIIYGKLVGEFKKIIHQEKTHTYLDSVDDAFVVIEGSVVRNFHLRNFIEHEKIQWIRFVQEINRYGYETYRLCTSIIEISLEKELLITPDEPKDSIDLVNRSFLKKTFDVGLDLSMLDPIFNGTGEYAINVLNGMVDLFLEKEIAFRIIADTNVIHKFQLERYSQYLIDPRHYEKNFFKLLFIPQQIFSVRALERINRNCFKFVFMMHDVIALRCRYTRKAGYSVTGSLSYKYSDEVLSVSRSSAEDIEAFFNERMIYKKVIPILNTKQAQPTDSDKDHSNSPVDKDYILVMGNGFKHKAIEKTLDTLTDSHWNIIVLADNLIFKKYKKNFKVLVSGDLSSKYMDDLYRYSSLILYPSLYEGFGLPVLASLQAGKKILVYDSHINRELMKEFDPKNLIHFFDSFSDISAKIGEILKDDPKTDNKRTNFRTWKEVGEETIKILIEALNRPLDFNRLNSRIFEISTMETVERYKQIADRDRIILELLSIRIKIQKARLIIKGVFGWLFSQLVEIFSLRRK